MRRLIAPTITCILAAALLAVLVYGISHQASNHTLDDAVAKGREPPAPQATRLLPVLSGHGQSSLSAYRGQVVVLNFWASWCTPCEEEAPLLESIEPGLLRHRATVLGVTYEDNTTNSREFVSRYHLSYPNLRDLEGDFARAYGTDKLPESFLINRRGQVVAISRGQINRPFTERALALARSS